MVDFAVEGAGGVGLFSFCADALVRTTMLPASKTTSSMRFELSCNLLTIDSPYKSSFSKSNAAREFLREQHPVKGYVCDHRVAKPMSWPDCGLPAPLSVNRIVPARFTPRVAVTFVNLTPTVQVAPGASVVPVQVSCLFTALRK